MTTSSRLPSPLRAALLVAVATLALLTVGIAGAHAKTVKLTGETTFTPSAQASQFLSANGITVTPFGAATANPNGSFTFPIVRGRGNPSTGNGVLVHGGGLQFSKGDKSVRLGRLVARRKSHGAYLSAKVSYPGCASAVRRHRRAARRLAQAARRSASRGNRRRAGQLRRAAAQHRRAARRNCGGPRIRIARLVNHSQGTQDGKVTLTADLLLSRKAARLINRVAGQQVVSAGALLGSATSTVSPAS
jgi:hypothetical protein